MFREMRRFKQALSLEECKELLKTEKRAALSVIGDDGYPYSVPVNFYYDEADNKIYIHSAMEGHKIDAIKANDKVCFTLWTQGTQPEKKWFYHVDSLVIFGRAILLKDPAKREEELYKFGAKYFPAEVDLAAEVNEGKDSIELITISIEKISGKHVKEK